MSEPAPLSPTDPRRVFTSPYWEPTHGKLPEVSPFPNESVRGQLEAQARLAPYILDIVAGRISGTPVEGGMYNPLSPELKRTSLQNTPGTILVADVERRTTVGPGPGSLDLDTEEATELIRTHLGQTPQALLGDQLEYDEETGVQRIRVKGINYHNHRYSYNRSVNVFYNDTDRKRGGCILQLVRASFHPPAEGEVSSGTFRALLFAGVGLLPGLVGETHANYADELSTMYRIRWMEAIAPGQLSGITVPSLNEWA